MRISTNTIYQTGINKISALQSEQYKLQQQVSSGKRILTPADDPVGAARALTISQAQSINSQYADNRAMASFNLNSIESTLTSVTDLMVSAKSTLVGAGNAVLSSEEKNYIATQLSNDLQELIGLANSKDGNGNYLFGGFKNTTQPYTATTTGATYNGDNGQMDMQVSDTRRMSTTENGPDVFQAQGNDVFATLSNIVDLLSNPATTSAALNTALASANTSLDKGLDNVLTVRASTGSKLKEIDALDNNGDDRNLQYKAELSDIQDLDYAQALSDITKQKTILEAAQQSYVQLSGLTLFKYI
ncbi:flagellar hook-associated protein 3 FlgL [Methylovorus glucosotrophus]|uniref:flagellar hook-associated protein FlgL n=1 Tax=Methylovorus glucosotrophus TaxID=266009 RepID=UPI001331C39E|nr:flagellar hook-associated protein FlgL [Methylovorus glucosotrophus]KAF0844639.1 flagellar hook-associated protein 3 FlgL [Methylovorus glucosotrophus]